MRATAYRQGGVGIVGMIMIATALIFLAVFGMKVVPPYIRNAQIQQIFKTVANDPAMQTATIREIRESYSRRADIESVSDLTADDIEIGKEGASISLSANYEVRIPVAGNITLMLEFNPSSD